MEAGSVDRFSCKAARFASNSAKSVKSELDQNAVLRVGKPSVTAFQTGGMLERPGNTPGSEMIAEVSP